MAVSSAGDFTGCSHFRRTLSEPSAPADKDVKRLVLCSGKVAYDLIEARDKAGDKHTAIVRIEQLYPFPSDPLVERLRKMPHLEQVVWSQEEPKNNGYWTFVEPFVEHCMRSEEHTSELQSLMRISYAVFCLKKKHNHKAHRN